VGGGGRRANGGDGPKVSHQGTELESGNGPPRAFIKPGLLGEDSGESQFYGRCRKRKKLSRAQETSIERKKGQPPVIGKNVITRTDLDRSEGGEVTLQTFDRETRNKNEEI